MKDKRLDILLEHLPMGILKTLNCKYCIENKNGDGYICIKSMKNGKIRRPTDCDGYVPECELED